MRDISIINDIKNTSSPNSVNSRGRKLCPITFDILTCNNSIKIENVIYSNKGFANWIRSELNTDYDRLYALCNVSETIYTKKNNFMQHMRIRSPMTNLYYDIPTISIIYNVFIDEYHIAPLNCVYNFITKARTP